MARCCLNPNGSHWVWSPSAHWKVYASLKRIAKKHRCLVILAGSDATALKDSTIQNYKKSGRSGDRAYSISSRGLVVSDFINAFSRKLQSNGSFSNSTKFRNPFSRSSSRSVFSEEERTLSNEEVNEILWENEKSIFVDNDGISHCDMNQLGSNLPNEDQMFATKGVGDSGVLIGILDGHGGCQYGEIVKTHLPYYLHCSLCSHQVLSSLSEMIDVNSLAEDLLGTTNRTSNHLSLAPRIRAYIQDILSEQPSPDNLGYLFSYISNPLRQVFGTGVMGAYSSYNSQVEIDYLSAIEKAFLRLDQDMIKDIKELSASGHLTRDNIGLALSGCCALVAYAVRDQLFLANSGDCRAVLGTYDNGLWSAVQLTEDHTAIANPDEVQRVIQEHPSDEQRSCIQYGRLLGRLAPLRALGDIQFKLPPDELRDIFKFYPKFQPMAGLKTPPYLTCKPEVFHYKLEERDKFVVLASDGLWDMLSNDEVVQLVGACLEGRSIDVLKDRAVLMGVPNAEKIAADKDAFMDTAGENVASYLIRFALNGYDRSNLHSMLTIPHPDVRMYRDDISVAVIFFDRKSKMSPVHRRQIPV